MAVLYRISSSITPRNKVKKRFHLSENNKTKSVYQITFLKFLKISPTVKKNREDGVAAAVRVVHI